MLEAGKRDNYHWIHIPVGYLFCMGNPRTDYLMQTQPDKGLNGRSLAYPRGKVLGGCSSINGMIYMRGQASDYNQWASSGCTGWSWQDVLPIFKQHEHYGPLESDSSKADNQYHGAGGEWRVNTQRLHWPVLDTLHKAANQMGVPTSDDFNTGTNHGVGLFEVNQQHGLRVSSAKAFLKPVLARPNLTVITQAQVNELTIEDGTCQGVSFTHKGKYHCITANKETLLAAGAIHSPALLERSGIGRRDVLEPLGITVKHELPGVGENLQDHLQIRTQFKIANATTLNELSHSLWAKLKMGVQYAWSQTGPLSMAPSQLGMFTHTDSRYDTPNVEFHIQPLTTDKLGDPLHKTPGVTVSVCNLRPTSRGSVHIGSTNRDEHPLITTNYLSTDQDRKVAADSIRLARQLMATTAAQSLNPVEMLPGSGIQDDASLAKAAGDIASTIFHPVGTCKMGVDTMAVVDPELKVHGIDGLRVIDASVMPTITSGNTSSPVLMIAERAARLLTSI